MEDLIERATKTITDLGIATRETLEPYLQAYHSRPPSEDTSDEDMVLAGFLTGLFRAKLITRNQGRTLLAMLTERAAPPPDDPYIGRRFGSYIAEEKVGEGAMGRVYRATREGTLERDFVIKVFGSRDPASVARFRREGEVMAALDHQNIVKVVATGQEGQVPYLVLEYVDGPTLQGMLEERGRFGWKSATRAVKQIAAAMVVAHDQGVIHRDIKPQNVLVTRGGMLKVFDFGLAKALDSKAVSQAGEILGSPAYMAPEQWGDHDVDGRVDIFALGVIFYLLISGQTPFRGRTPADYATAIREGRFQPLLAAVPEVPGEVSALVSQMLERDRNDRLPSARILVSELDRLLKGKYPNLPRLEGGRGEAEVRYPLVGADTFTVGSVADAAVQLSDPGVAEHHATLQRTVNGVLLRVEGGATVHVDGNRVLEIVLRDKDTVRFGDAPPLTYRSGNLARRVSSRVVPPSERLAPVVDPSESAAKAPPAVVAGILAAALTDAAHPRALLGCFEALDPYTLELKLNLSRLRLAQAGCPEQEAERAMTRARELGQERSWALADQLFTITKENLGRSVEPWLAWWFEVRERYPRQLRGPETRARGTLTVTPPDRSVHTLELDEGEEWTLGRSEEADIAVKEQSVSRIHLTILRLHTRFAFKDMGSRFGTTLGGDRREVGLLRHEDELRLGRARCLFKDWLQEHLEERTSAGEGPHVELDRHTFQALVEQRSPATVSALVGLVDTATLADQAVNAAAPYEGFASVGALVMSFLDAQREVALAALPEITGVDLGGDPEAWRTWFAEQGAQLGPQVVPAGWF